MFQTGLAFDMRAPDIGAPAAELFPVAFEMIEYADGHHIGHVNFPEHHCSPDGFVPTPMLMAAAAAVRTRRMGIMAGAVVLPLHDPVEVAEQIAVLDLISGGRSHVALAAGYAEAEFRAFGKSMHDRAQLMDEGLEVIVRALSGERFENGGRPVFVSPLPPTGTANIYVGGGVPAAARRAARFGLNLWTLDDKIVPLYAAECQKLGKPPGKVIRPRRMVFVADDPDRAWSEIAPFVLHTVRSYAAMSTSAAQSSSPWHGLDTLDAAKASGIVTVGTPEECIAIGRETAIMMNPLIGGLAPDIGWESLELFATKVAPALAGA
jgi:alkanesulfonate monooxygenase SsuD/methylene tetrahydromethanopterin reductase-like flavin-dependent oxidoreductase (luciferase family)